MASHFYWRVLCPPLLKKYKRKELFRLIKLINNKSFIIFAPKCTGMTLQKWIKDRAIHGYPTFSIEDVRNIGMYSSEQILQNELSRLCANKTIATQSLLRPGISFNASDAYMLIFETFIDKMEGKRD
jgi:hypothetical protein